MNPDSFAEENSKPSMEVVAWFLLAAYSLIPEERDTLRARWSKKRTRTWRSGTFVAHPDTKKNEKVSSGENRKNVGEPTSGREMSGVTPAGSNQPFLQEQGIGMGSSRKNPWRTLQFVATDAPDIRGKLLRQQKHSQPGLKETEKSQREGRKSLRAEPQIPRPEVEPQGYRLPPGAQKVDLDPQMIILKPWNLMERALLGCKPAWDFGFLLFRMGLSTLGRPHHSIFGGRWLLAQVRRWRGILFQDGSTWSLTHTWCRWFRRWGFGPIWIDDV